MYTYEEDVKYHSFGNTKTFPCVGNATISPASAGGPLHVGAGVVSSHLYCPPASWWLITVQSARLAHVLRQSWYVPTTSRRTGLVERASSTCSCRHMRFFDEACAGNTHMMWLINPWMHMIG